MKVIIQSIATRTYLKSLKQWTSELDEAKNFGYFERAAHFVRKQNLREVQFAVPLPESDEVIVFPVV
ncbi:MAG TPA: hypothetical protein VG754_12810 [Verrucomicrobiae bacterium]|nr:hypothetical protein [Verrucomicrobiae bacterium]